ncbi:MAG: sialate O-acetylesterase [Bacteroidota bacterium]|nr:sialate O-acetylesterase [Bacteroidota bacterium]
MRIVKIIAGTLRLSLLSSILLLSGPVLANVKLPAIFSDGMVLQQNTKVAIWGWADPGEKIKISGSWSPKSVFLIADASGNWKGMLQTPKAGGPYTLSIKANNSITLNDVLSGEVWVCSGQSNMGFTLKGCDNSKEEIAAANYPVIRYFSVERQYGLKEFRDCPGSVWKKTSPSTAPSFSAVAYFFARKIHKDLKVPVGIVFNAWGGTPAEAWTPANVLRKDSTLSLYFDRWKFIQDNVGKDSANYHVKLDKWQKDSIGLKRPAEPQTLYYYKRPWREPSVLYNGMLTPVIPYSIKGVLWYQGESNVDYANEYYKLFSSMIQSWRSNWSASNDFPFYFVQIASYGYNNLDKAAQLREAQYQVMRNIHKTGMAVTVDLGDMKNIHFTHKKEVGDRLALIALANDYGHKDLLYKGPECNKVYVSNEKVIVEFKPSKSALTVKGNALNGFELGYKLPGSDSVSYVAASAKIEGDKVTVWNTKVNHPIEVRYGWLLAGDANLFNKEGLPAFPFRMKVK